MITEHNFETIYLLEIKTRWGWCFLGSRLTVREEDAGRRYLTREDAERYLRERNPEKYNEQIRIVEINFPFRLEYQIDPRIDHWQRMRVYRTYEAALLGFARSLICAYHSPLKLHTWRLIVIATGEIIQQLQPIELVS